MAKVLAELEESQDLRAVDAGALAMLAENFDTFFRAMRGVARDGQIILIGGRPARHPLLKVAQDAQIQAVKLMIEFGLTIKSRERLKGAPTGEDDDPLGAFLSNIGSD